MSILAACGPSLPSAGTETDAGGTSSTGAPASTTSGEASSGEASAATTAASTTAEPTTSTGGASTTAGATTDGVETGGTTGEPLPSCCMVPDVANADVAGATPLGPIALTWAWSAIHGGECGGRRVHVYEDPSQLGTEPGPRLEIFIDDLVEMPGTFPAWFTVVDAQGKQEAVEGLVDVTAVINGSFEPSWCSPGDPVVRTDVLLEVAFSIVADGWDVAGKASAPYCPQLNIICP